MTTLSHVLPSDTYKIQYFDGLVKTVNSDFLRVWKAGSSSGSPSGQITISQPNPTTAQSAIEKNQNLSRGILSLSARRRPVTGVGRMKRGRPRNITNTAGRKLSDCPTRKSSSETTKPPTEAGRSKLMFINSIYLNSYIRYVDSH